MSPPMSKRITCLESWGNEHTFVGSGCDVLGWRRLTCFGKIGSHPGMVSWYAGDRSIQRSRRLAGRSVFNPTCAVYSWWWCPRFLREKCVSRELLPE